MERNVVGIEYMYRPPSCMQIVVHTTELAINFLTLELLIQLFWGLPLQLVFHILCLSPPPKLILGSLQLLLMLKR